MMVVPRTTWISRETLSSVANLRSLFLLERWCDCHHGLVTEWLMLSRGPPVRGGSAPDPEGSEWCGVSASDRLARAVSPPATRSWQRSGPDYRSARGAAKTQPRPPPQHKQHS